MSDTTPMPAIPAHKPRHARPSRTTRALRWCRGHWRRPVVWAGFLAWAALTVVLLVQQPQAAEFPTPPAAGPADARQAPPAAGPAAGTGESGTWKRPARVAPLRDRAAEPAQPEPQSSADKAEPQPPATTPPGEANPEPKPPPAKPAPEPEPEKRRRGLIDLLPLLGGRR